MIERKNKIYIWNELHSIVVVKYKHSSISGRSPTGGGKKIILFCSQENRKHHNLEWALTELANTLKNVFEQKFLWSFIDFFRFLYTQFSRKANWKQWSFTKLADLFYQTLLILVLKNSHLSPGLLVSIGETWKLIDRQSLLEFTAKKGYKLRFILGHYDRSKNVLLRICLSFMDLVLSKMKLKSAYLNHN